MRISDWSSDVCSSDLAVERVDDPDAALTAAGRVVLFFFGQQRIGGARGADFAAEHRIGGFVARLAEPFANEAARAQVEQDRTRCVRQPFGELFVAFSRGPIDRKSTRLNSSP